MKYQFSLLIIIALFAFTKQEIEASDLSAFEKDKYLACHALSYAKIEADKEQLEEMIKDKDEEFKKAIRRQLGLEMTQVCLDQITDEQVKIICEDLIPKKPKVDIKEVNFVFDYEPYKAKTEMQMTGKLMETLNIIRALIKESNEKRRMFYEGNAGQGNDTMKKPKKPEKKASDLSFEEKDKYLACNSIVMKKLQFDKEKVDEAFKENKDDFLVKGIQKTMSLEMINKCIKEISLDKANMLFVDTAPQDENVNLKDFDFEFDYEPFGKKKEFIFEPHLLETFNIMRDLIRESQENTRPPEEKKEETKNEETKKEEPKKTVKRSAGLTVDEKDKYLACQSIVFAKFSAEKDKIEEIIKGKEQKVAGSIKRTISLEMVLACYKTITLEKTHLLFNDGYAQKNEYDLIDLDFPFDYSKYKDINEVIADPHLVETMELLKELIQESREKTLKSQKPKEEPKKEEPKKEEEKPKEEPKKEEEKPKEEPKKEEEKPKEETQKEVEKSKEELKKEEQKLLEELKKEEELIRQEIEEKKKKKAQERKATDLSQDEKDIYLACDLIVRVKIKNDKEKIEELLKEKNDDLLVRGLKKILMLDMISKCISQLTIEKAHNLFVNATAQTKEIDLKDLDFEFDYTPIKDKNEFIFEDKQTELMNILRDLVSESRAKSKPPEGSRNVTSTHRKTANLTDVQKDKYLACNAIMISKQEKDKEIIEAIFKSQKNETILKELQRNLNLEMILSCYVQITDEQARMIYVDLLPQVQKVDLEKVNFEFDYEPFKNKTEFPFEDHLIDALDILRELVRDHAAKKRKIRLEMEAKAKEAAEKAKKEEEAKKEDETKKEEETKVKKEEDTKAKEEEKKAKEIDKEKIADL